MKVSTHFPSPFYALLFLTTFYAAVLLKMRAHNQCKFMQGNNICLDRWGRAIHCWREKIFFQHLLPQQTDGKTWIRFMPRATLPQSHEGSCGYNIPNEAISSMVLINSQTNAITDGLTPINLITDAQNADEDENSSKPEFVNKVPSLSITKGKDAVMRCTVKNLGNNVISWHHLESNSDLTINKQVLKSDSRIRIKQEQDSWLLVINNVSLEDKGFYVCRINWQPNSQLAYLNVVVPPKFDENSFPNNHEIVIQEYINLTLRCRATGDPQPKIEWRHEDGGPIILSTPTDMTTSLASSSPRRIEGEELHFRPITRWSMGSYLCIASNGVPPSISRRLMITVHFPPVIRIVQQSMVVIRGQNAVLQCLVESCPLAEQQWIHPNGEVISEESKKYSLDTEETYHFKVVHQLTIKNAEIEDTGEFICVVNNSIGEAKSSIKLQVLKEPPKPSHIPKSSTPKTTIKYIENSKNEKGRKSASYPSEHPSQPNSKSKRSLALPIESPKGISLILLFFIQKFIS